MFLIAIAAFIPIPGMPILFISYKINGLTGGFISAYFGGAISGVLQYLIAKKYFFKIFNRLKKYKVTKKLLKYSKEVNNLSFLELTFFMLSSIPSIIKIPACGIARIKFRKFISCFVVTSIFCQLLILFSLIPAQQLDSTLIKLGVNETQSLLLSFSTYSLMFFIILLLLKKLRKNKTKFDS